MSLNCLWQTRSSAISALSSFIGTFKTLGDMRMHLVTEVGIISDLPDKKKEISTQNPSWLLRNCTCSVAFASGRELGPKHDSLWLRIGASNLGFSRYSNEWCCRVYMGLLSYAILISLFGCIAYHTHNTLFMMICMLTDKHQIPWWLLILTFQIWLMILTLHRLAEWLWTTRCFFNTRRF